MAETRTREKRPGVEERLARLEQENARLREQLAERGEGERAEDRMHVAVETASVPGPSGEAWDFETIRAGERRSGSDPLVQKFPDFWRDEIEVTPEEAREAVAQKYASANAEARREDRRREKAEQERLRKEQAEAERRGAEWGRTWDSRWRGLPTEQDFATKSRAKS